MSARHLAALLVLALDVQSGAQTVNELAQHFGQLPEMAMPRLSPDGRYLAMQIPRDGVPSILASDLDNSGRDRWLLSTTPGGFKIADCQWAKNDRLICIVDYTSVKNSQPYYEFAIYSMSPDGKEAKEILVREPWVRLVNRLPDDPVNIAIEKLSNVGWPALYLVNVYTGFNEMLAPAKPPASRWELSDDGQTAVAYGLEVAGRTTINFDEPELWAWHRQTEEFVRIAPEVRADLYFDLVGLDSGGKNALLLGNDGGRRALLAAPVDGQPTRTLVRDDMFDVTSFSALPGLTHRAGRAAVMTDVLEHRWLEPGMANSQRQLDSVVPGARAFVETASYDLRRSVVRFDGDRVAPRYVLFDAKAQPRVLGLAYPNVDDAKLGAMRLARVRMRDGTAIDVFITEPTAQAPGPARAVVLPHGGPEARDLRRFDFIAQFLAANGYAVLQPNFRGSWGYGRDFLEAGRRGWGIAMHNDITDAARWALDEKLAEPGHICIVGASYGGYAALLGVAKEPDLYACAVSIAGPSDLGNLLWDFNKDAGPHARRLARERIGWQRDELDAQSPLELVADVKAPILLIHGRLDSRVEADHSERMARALRSSDKAVELIIQRNGDHFLSDEPQRIETLRELGRFLAEHL
jgi:dipeptidyl aminopeptidase/acylaminoacyl peptidase